MLFHGQALFFERIILSVLACKPVTIKDLRLR